MAINKKKLAKKNERKPTSAQDVAAEMYEQDEEINRLLANSNRKKEIQQAVSDGLLVPQEDGWYYKRFRIASTGLIAPRDVNESEYAEVGQFLLDVASRIQWLLGDWLAFGEDRKWGETYTAVAAEFGYSEKTLREYAYVARNVDLSIRMDKLSFGHHQLIAQYSKSVQRKWLQLATGNGWSIAQLRAALKASAGQQQLPAPVPKWRKPAQSVIEQYSQKTWGNMTPDQRTEVYNDLQAKLREMEQWGFDDSPTD